MIWRCLGDRRCCVATPKGALSSGGAGASGLTQPTPGSSNLLSARTSLCVSVALSRARKRLGKHSVCASRRRFLTVKNLVFLSLLFAGGLLWIGLSHAGIPATPVMTLYKFNGKRDLPYYEIESLRERGPSSPAGTLAQGISLIPCLVIRVGQALTDEKGMPYVGFRIVVDPRKATPAATGSFKRAFAQRKSMRVANITATVWLDMWSMCGGCTP